MIGVAGVLKRLGGTPPAGPTLIAEASAMNENFGVTATTSAIDTTGATLLVVSTNATLQDATITDSKGNTWTALTGQTNAGPPIGNYSKIFYCASAVVGTGHTFSADLYYPVLIVTAWSGIGATPFDVENGSTGAAATISTGSVSPSTSQSLVIAAATAAIGTSPPLTVDSGFTMISSYSSGGNAVHAQAYKILSSATSENPTFTLPSSASAIGLIAVFKY